MRSFSKKLAFVLAAAMVVTAFAPAAKAEAAKEMAINKQGKILYVTDGKGINDAAQVGGGKGNVSSYDFAVSNKPANWKNGYTFAWSSSDEDVITVKNGGLTTAVGVGKADVVCVVTEKATGKATTLKNTVTVKANAADVVITNADDYANTAVEVGDVVDLNRAMYDANGTKAPKRGVVVTDYTRWMVEPSTGVKVDSTKGTFEFTDEAVAGEYKLWAETYQSKKYQAATAKSDVVKVELVKSNTFEVDQTASNKFDLIFEKDANIAISDVTVNKIIKVGNSTGKIPQVVSGVAASQDKKVASVSLFTNLQDGYNYEISVKGYDETVTMTAVVGKPISMTVSSKSGIEGGVFVTVKTATELTYTLYDGAGNDVTNTVTGTVSFKPAVSSTSDYYVAGKTIYIYKEGAEVTVNAEYNSGKYENGKPVDNVQGTGYFVGIAPTPITVAEVSLAVKDSNGGAYANNNVPLSDTTASLELKIKTTKANDYAQVYTNGQTVGNIGGNVKVAFRSSNPDVFAIAGNKINLFKEGTSAVLVDLVTTEANGTQTVSTIAAYYVTVVAKRATSTVEVGSNGQLTVGTVAPYDSEKINVTAKDQYGAVVRITNLKDVKFADGTAVPTAAYELIKNEYGQDKIKFNGPALANKIEATANEAYLYMTAKVTAGGVDKDINFVVVVKKPITNMTYLSVEAGGTTSGNIGRYVDNQSWNDNAEKQKTAEFKVFTMSNGIKVDQNDVFKKFGNTVADGVTTGSLFYTVDRDGADVTAVSSVDVNGTVKIDYSKFENFETATVSGSAVIYRTSNWSAMLGAGTYTFTLYKVVEDTNGNKSYAYESAASCTVTCDTGAYSLVKRVSEVAQYTDANGVTVKLDNSGLNSAYNQAVLRNCFAINGTDGKNTTNGIYKVNAKNADGYVFVENIVFYEEVETGVYASYTVNVNVSLVKPQ